MSINPSDMGNSFADNVADVWNCVAKSKCAAVPKPDSGFGFALMLAIALSIGGILLYAWAIGYVLESKNRGNGNVSTRNRYKIDSKGAKSTLLIASVAIPWTYLFFAYAVPLATGIDNYIGWAFWVPILTLIMMIGPVGIAAYAIFLVGSLQGSFTVLPSIWWKRLLLLIAAVAVLYGWRYVYLTVPQISRGPFGQGPEWAQEVMKVPVVNVPLTAFWWLLTLLASIGAIVVFAALCVVSMLLMGTSNKPSAVTRTVETATGNVAALAVGTVLSIVIGFFAFVVLLFAFMIFSLYVMTYMLILYVVGSVVVGVIRK